MQISGAEDSIDSADGASASVGPGIFSISYLSGSLVNGPEQVMGWSVPTGVFLVRKGTSEVVSKQTNDPFIFWVPDNAAGDNGGSWTIQVSEAGGATTTVVVDNAADSVDPSDGLRIDAGSGLFYFSQAGGSITNSPDVVIGWSIVTGPFLIRNGAPAMVAKQTNDPFIFWIPDTSGADNGGSWTLRMVRVAIDF